MQIFDDGDDNYFDDGSGVISLAYLTCVTCNRVAYAMETSRSVIRSRSKLDDDARDDQKNIDWDITDRTSHKETLRDRQPEK